MLLCYFLLFEGGSVDCIEARAATGIIVPTRTFGDVASQEADLRGRRIRCPQDMAYCPRSFGGANEGRPETRRDDAKWVYLALYPCKVPRARSRATPFHEGGTVDSGGSG
jgi:hypothetical protein